MSTPQQAGKGDQGGAVPVQAEPDPVAGHPAGGEELTGRQRAARGVLAQAGQAGSAGERREVEREAKAGLASVNGVQITGGTVNGGNYYDFRVLNSRSQLRSYQLEARQVAEVKATFVQSGDYPDLAQGAQGQRLLLLRGRPGSGRTAVGWRLLLAGGASALAMLAPETDLGALGRADLTPGTGYLLTGLSGPAINRLDPFLLARLAAELAAEQCRLVVVLPESFQHPGKELFALTRTPAHQDVVRAHLAWGLGAGADRADAVLARPDVRRVLAERLDAFTPLSAAAELGALLADVELPGGDLEGWLLLRRWSGLSQDLDEWFRELPDLQTQALGVALSVLAGEPYETVSLLAEALKRRLQPPADEVRRERDRSTALQSSRRRRLELLGAEVVPGEVASRHGTAPGMIVRFRAPGRQRELLLHFWDEYDDHRSAVLAWLRECARHELVSVRVRAAVAAGVLAVGSFDLLRATVLDAWAGSADELQREAAATALNTAAEAPELGEPVREVVRSWASAEADEEFRATAARSWRVLLDQPGGAALRLLHDLAGTEDVEVMDALFRTLADQFATGEERHRREVLQLLRYWVLGTDPQRRLVGELSFLYVAVDLVENRPARSADPGRWPTLLAVSAADPVRQSELAELWAAVLGSADSWEVAQSCLGSWARQLETDPAGRRALGRLLARAAEVSPRTERLLRHLAGQWNNPDGAGLPLVSAEVGHRLDERKRQP
ncbi:hypothetical protein OHV05_13500 [Kitasatospora sp. NBC_00070]|uniref:hypothetical protein n=1 Tax=Kitasatospora sp. NBC_00070 TaxID=2975962 RepID=UPI003247B441